MVNLLNFYFNQSISINRLFLTILSTVHDFRLKQLKNELENVRLIK